MPLKIKNALINVQSVESEFTSIEILKELVTEVRKITTNTINLIEQDQMKDRNTAFKGKSTG